MNDDDVNDTKVFDDIVDAIGEVLGDEGHRTKPEKPESPDSPVSPESPESLNSWTWEKGQNRVVFDESPKPEHPHNFYSAKLRQVKPGKRFWMTFRLVDQKDFKPDAKPREVAKVIQDMLDWPS